jgi:hypothetical protein
MVETDHEIDEVSDPLNDLPKKQLSAQFNHAYGSKLMVNTSPSVGGMECSSYSPISLSMKSPTSAM